MSDLELVPGIKLAESHPLAGRDAYRCLTCGGISYPEHQSTDGPCPYCEDDGA